VPRPSGFLPIVEYQFEITDFLRIAAALLYRWPHRGFSRVTKNLVRNAAGFIFFKCNSRSVLFLDTLWQELRGFAGNESQDDDMTALA